VKPTLDAIERASKEDPGFGTEEFWEDLRNRPAPPPSAVLPPEHDDFVLYDKAHHATVEELKAKFQQYDGQPVTSEMLAAMISAGASTFFVQWKKAQASEARGLFGCLMASADGMTPAEIQALVRALPRTLLDRSLANLSGVMLGYHGLLALESHRRDGKLDNYRVVREVDGRIAVDFYSPQLRKPMRFFLDETLGPLCRSSTWRTTGKTCGALGPFLRSSKRPSCTRRWRGREGSAKGLGRFCSLPVSSEIETHSTKGSPGKKPSSALGLWPSSRLTLLGEGAALTF
jgi:hypothetical protein